MPNASRAGKRGNILFITADQWRGDCLSALGHPVVKTPHLDALAAEGTLFTRHFANASPCGPSRASIHTGLYARRHGVWRNAAPLSFRFDNWALGMRRRNIRPILFGYTDTVLPDGRIAALPGLDTIVAPGPTGKSVANPQAWAAWLRRRGYSIPADPVDLYVARGPGTGDAPRPLAVPAQLHDTWFMVDQVLNYIAQHSSERNEQSGWCIHLSLLRPHPPWVAPAPYNSLYPPEEMPPFARAANIEDEGAQHPYLTSLLEHNAHRAPADKTIRRWQATYYGLMTEVDDNLGRLFKALKDAGEWSRTLVVFTSDHGEQMGDHWLVGKSGFFDQSYAVPLIVYDPSTSADANRGASVDAFSESVDIMPTLLDWLGLDVPEQCDGRSLVPLVHAGKAPADWRPRAHWEYAMESSPPWAHLTVARGKRFKLVRFPTLPPLLYDIENDPAESTNLATREEFRDLLKEESERLSDWESCGGHGM